MCPEITLIAKRDADPLMSKRIFLTKQGEVRSDGSQCLMVQGTATRATAETASELAKQIVSCRSDQAIALGALNTELPDLVTITTERRLKDRAPYLALGSSSTIARKHLPGR